jgi:PPOX class probable F420-dependent enzyme
VSPRLTTEEAWTVLAEAHTGILTTLKGDGTPISLPMWFVALDERIYVVTPARSKKVGRVTRDPRVSFLVESGTRWIELQAVHLTGRARVVDDDDLHGRVRDALDHKYAAFRTEGGDRNVDDIVFALIEIVPDDRILTWDNSRERARH